jgi:hypothetical protein
VETFTLFSGVIFCVISNSVYIESGRQKREKLSVSRDMSQADIVLRFCEDWIVTLIFIISIIRQFLLYHTFLFLFSFSLNFYFELIVDCMCYVV